LFTFVKHKSFNVILSTLQAYYSQPIFSRAGGAALVTSLASDRGTSK